MPDRKLGFRAAARALTSADDEPADEDAGKRRDRGDRDGGFQTLMRRKFPRRALNTYASLRTTGPDTAGAGRPGHIAADASDDAGEYLVGVIDSMNPYWQPDAHLIEIGGVDDDCNPPQDYYPLQL